MKIDFPKKSQISIFIAIAIILVLLIGVVFYFSSGGLNIWETEKSSYKVREFVEDCMELEAREGVEKIAKAGGWLYHPEMTFTDRSKPEQYNKVAKGLSFLEVQNIPYWYYFDDANEAFVINIPEFATDREYSIKNQLKKYIDDNLEKNCLQSFIAFESIYQINYEPKEIDSNVEFENSKIKISLDLPMEIVELNTEGSSEYIDFFNKEMDNRLETPYYLLRDIVIAEAKSSFVEHRMIHFMNAYQSSNPVAREETLPPFYDFRMDYDFKPWDLQKSEDLFKQILNSNLGLIQFLNTNYETYSVPEGLEDNEFAVSFSNLYTKDYISEHSLAMTEKPDVFNDFKNYQVETIYEPFFPMYFSVSPSAGNIILLPRPEAIINILPFFFTEYVSVYEIASPIMFVVDDNPYDTFEFSAVIEANIDYNTPKAENRNYGFETVNLNLDEGKSLICDPPQFISEYVKLEIADPVLNGERKVNYNTRQFNMPEGGVEDAIISFDCKGISQCFIGETEVNATTNKTELKFRLPINCNPGRLEIYKYGHEKLVFENLNPNLNSEIDLGKHYMSSKKKVETKIKMIQRGDSKFSSGRSLGTNDKAFIIFQHKTSEDMVAVAEITRENQYDIELDLLPGNYTVQGFVIYDKATNIPSEEICYKTGLFSEDCQTLPAIELGAWVRGGIELDNFEVPVGPLLGDEVLYINLVDFGVPNTYSALQGMSDTLGDLKDESKNKEPYFDIR